MIAALALFFSLVALFRVRGMRGNAKPGAFATSRPMGVDAERIDSLSQGLSEFARRLQAAEAQGQRAIQRVGVVRYNPFADTGSNQSFVLAILDARGDGFVLSSLHSRQQTRVFLKQVSGGRAEGAVSDEEAEAIRQATAK